MKFELLNIIEFTSARKWMTAIIWLDNGMIKVLTKGADSIIIEWLRDKNDPLIDKSSQYLNKFASIGLWTLLLAEKFIKEETYIKWADWYQEAMLQLNNKEELLDALNDELEQDFILIGSTAIEDKLQD